VKAGVEMSDNLTVSALTTVFINHSTGQPQHLSAISDSFRFLLPNNKNATAQKNFTV
jgi:hypothetical protein